jgi:hypothetical protein
LAYFTLIEMLAPDPEHLAGNPFPLSAGCGIQVNNASDTPATQLFFH